MKELIAATLITTMAFSMTACGTGSSSETTASVVSTEAKPAETTSTAETTAKAPSDKKWIITTDTAFMPFEYTDETGAFVGIDVDILAAVAEDQGFAYDLQVLGWDGAVAAVQSGQADAIIAGASITEERKSNGWIFTDGYYNASETIAVSKDTEISSWDDLKGKNVAVKNGTTGCEYAESLKDQYGFTITKFEDSPTMYQDVLAGNSVACFDDTPVMAANIKQHDLALKIPDGFENEGSPYGMAIMNSENQELIDMFNEGLKNIQANGTYDAILDKYLK